MRAEARGRWRCNIRSGAEEKDHAVSWLAFWDLVDGAMCVHHGVWEAHFGAVYDAIAYTFHQCKNVMVLWIKDDLFQCRLRDVSTQFLLSLVRIRTSSACNLSISRSQK